MHHALSDFVSAGTPVTKELTGLFHTNGKRPDGLTLIHGRAVSLYAWT